MPKPEYAAEKLHDHDSEVVLLADRERDVEVRIFPAGGNRAYSMKVHGQEILHFPYDDAAAIRTSPHLNGIPFLAPWANRMPDGFYANGRHYRFNPESEWLRRDSNGIPIHGLLTACPFWRVSELLANGEGALVTSRLEFWRHAGLMTNWPIAHEYEMTYRLFDGELEVRIAVRNLSSESMPVAIGFHPYFVLPGARIRETRAHVPVRMHVETDARLVPTGELKPVSLPNPVALADRHFDDGFTGLERDADGRTGFFVESAGRKIECVFGSRYTVAIVFAPPGQDYICFEPMTAITNGINLAQEGKYAGLQVIAPGEEWGESFWVRTEGI